MRFYLSSYRIGDYGQKLVEMVAGGELAYIPNALDHVPAESQREARERNLGDLESLGISCRVLDLREYFDSKSQLPEELGKFAGVWVTGGNTFVLRQAMALSGFDRAVTAINSPSFLYAGYSAGVCVLAPDLNALQIVDDPGKFPYPQQSEVIWKGLNIMNHIVLPHYKSDHPESADIDKEVAYCKENGIPFKTLRDGEVLFGEDIAILNRGIEINH